MNEMLSLFYFISLHNMPFGVSYSITRGEEFLENLTSRRFFFFLPTRKMQHMVKKCLDKIYAITKIHYYNVFIVIFLI